MVGDSTEKESQDIRSWEPEESDSVEVGMREYHNQSSEKAHGRKEWVGACMNFAVYVLAVLLAVALVACGSIVSSKRSTPQYSPTSPIRVGDAIVYYLPTGVIKVDGVFDKDKGWIVTVTPDIYADSSQRYELSLNQRYPFFDHTSILTTDEKGLLKTVNGTSTDRTVDAIGSLITAGGQALQFAASLATRALDSGTPPPFHITLNPFDPNKQEVRASGFVISVTQPADMTQAKSQDEVSSREDSYPGIMTRLLAVFTVKVKPASGEACQTTVSLPDRRQRYLLSVPRGPLVTSETTVDFVNGMMVTRNMKRPSLAYGIIGIPKTILSALVPIPGNVQTAENTRIQNQINLLKETKELQQLQNPTPTATPTAAPTGATN
jgi:hypothetical protein